MALGLGLGIAKRFIVKASAPIVSFIWGTPTAKNWGEATTQTWGAIVWGTATAQNWGTATAETWG
jgi:hypothetical protein